MPKYEYLVVVRPVESLRGLKELTAALNTYGAEGWQLTNIIHRSEPAWPDQFIFIREVENDG